MGLAANLAIFILIHFTYSRWPSTLPSCLWSLRIFLPLPGSRLTIFSFIAMQVQHSYNSSANGWILLTHVLTLTFRYGRQNKNPAFDKNRTHDFRTTSGCAPLGRRGLIVYYCSAIDFTQRWQVRKTKRRPYLRSKISPRNSTTSTVPSAS